jgi:hypothetical protein
MAFTAPLDIANRACQYLGIRRISTLGENSPGATEINSCFDKLRQAELNAHVWRFACRRAALRVITSTTKLITFPTYAAGTTYQQGDVVNDTTANQGNSGTALYISLAASNTGNTPSTSPTKWTPYFGPDVAEAYSTTDTYSTGELVWVTTNTYLSLQNANLNNTPSSGSPWTAAALTGATNATLFIPYPISQASSGITRNLYRLPVGYMRVAPQDVKIAGGSWQTSSAGQQWSDYEFEGNYLLTAQVPQVVASGGPLIFRFCADISDVSQMNPQFCEGLAVRIAYDICERVTLNRQLKDQLAQRYTQLLRDARRDNMLEQGSTDPEENDYLTARSAVQVAAPQQQERQQ